MFNIKVFISYGNAADQITALRLQALAAANGLTVYVPPAFTRQPNHIFLDPESSQQIKDADVVLGVVGFGLAESCRQEINTAISLQKTLIVMCHPQFQPLLQGHFGSSLIVIDPANPDRAEHGIVQYLQALNAEQNKKTALLALGTLALGLLIFAPSK